MAEKITKSDAVRRAIAAGHTMPTAGVAYIKETFGLTMTPLHFSAVKGAEAKKGRIKVKGKRGRPKGSTNAAGKVASGGSSVGNGLTQVKASRAVSPKTGDDVLDALEALKPLVARFGAAQVKRIADVLG